jgi:hypothetical protein
MAAAGNYVAIGRICRLNLKLIRFKERIPRIIFYRKLNLPARPGTARRH